MLYLGTKTSWNIISKAAPVEKVSIWGIQLFGVFFGVIKNRD